MEPSGPEGPRTYFAPAGRSEPAALQQEIAACLESPVASIVLDTLDGLVAILNEHRQILAGNAALVEALEAEGAAAPVGLRPGEALGCVHVEEGPDGCGTSRACRNCGAVLAILAAQAAQEEAVSGECLLSLRRSGKWKAAEFQVHARAAQLGGHPCTVIVFHDISAQKRRDVMESLFFHDIMNMLHGLRAWGDTLQLQLQDPSLAAQHMVSLSERLNRQIAQHRVILLAEQGQLPVHGRVFEVGRVLEDLSEECRLHRACVGRSFRIEDPGNGHRLDSDPELLERVLLNMGVNALEAVPPGGHVSAGFRLEAGVPTFYVWNEGAIPEAAALSVFQRSFSTKATRGRGLGTYAMKLLGENYLMGRVGFRSTPEEGTTFFIHLPEASLVAA